MGQVLCSHVMDAVCREFRYSRREITAYARFPEIVLARQVATGLMVRYGIKADVVAAYLRRDVATVWSNSDRLAERLRNDRDLGVRVAIISGAIERAANAEPPAAGAASPAAVAEGTVLPPAEVLQIKQLKQRGWSLDGLCRRFRRQRCEIAPIIGVMIGERE